MNGNTTSSPSEPTPPQPDPRQNAGAHEESRNKLDPVVAQLQTETALLKAGLQALPTRAASYCFVVIGGIATLLGWFGVDSLKDAVVSRNITLESSLAAQTQLLTDALAKQQAAFETAMRSQADSLQSSLAAQRSDVANALTTQVTTLVGALKEHENEVSRVLRETDEGIRRMHAPVTEIAATSKSAAENVTQLAATSNSMSRAVDQLSPAFARIEQLLKDVEARFGDRSREFDVSIGRLSVEVQSMRESLANVSPTNASYPTQGADKVSPQEFFGEMTLAIEEGQYLRIADLANTYFPLRESLDVMDLVMLCHGLIVVRRHSESVVTAALGLKKLETAKDVGDVARARSSLLSKRALAFNALEDIGSAKTDLYESISHWPENAEALNTLGRILFEERDFGQAILHLERAVAVDKSDDSDESSALLENLALCFLLRAVATSHPTPAERTKDLASAEAYARRAIDVALANSKAGRGSKDDQGSASLAMAQVQAELDNGSEARKYYRKAIEFDPHLKSLARVLGIKDEVALLKAITKRYQDQE